LTEPKPTLPPVKVASVAWPTTWPLSRTMIWLPLDRIAELAGFEYTGYMSDAFLKHTGLRPGA